MTDGMGAGRSELVWVDGQGAGRVELVRVAEGQGGGRLDRPLTAALSKAAGVPLVVAAVRKGHRHRAVIATGWPVTRWVRRFRPDPLRRLRIGVAAEREPVGHTSLPAASAVQRAQVETAIRDVGEAAATDLPQAWGAAVRRAARSREAELPDAVDRAVGRTSLRETRRPRWWRAVNVLQWLLFATMVAGAGWLGVLLGMDYLRLPQPPLPTAGSCPGPPCCWPAARWPGCWSRCWRGWPRGWGAAAGRAGPRRRCTRRSVRWGRSTCSGRWMRS